MNGILIDDSGNLIVKKGTLEIGDTKVQDAALLMGAFTGEFKHAPMLGGNVNCDFMLLIQNGSVLDK